MFQYEKDTSKVGTASDYGKQLMIGNRHININQLNKFDDKIYLQAILTGQTSFMTTSIYRKSATGRSDLVPD